MRTRPSFGRGALLIAALATTGFVHARMDTAAAARSGGPEVPDPRYVRMLALGFDAVLADYYWVQALQLVGGGTTAREQAETVGSLIEVVTALDPWVDHPYRFAALWLIGGPEQVRRANELLRRGISYHPDDWRNRFYLGYNQFFYLGENLDAALTLESAIDLAGAPGYLGALATRLRAEGGSLDAAAHFLKELIARTDDEYLRAGYLKSYDEIETERRARWLDAARLEFWERHGRDIRGPAELWSGPLRIVDHAPAAHPHFGGFHWEMAEETGQIVSSFYKSRYRIHVHELDRGRNEAWRAAEAEQQSEEPI